jgi:XRE family aerobic/anaerobic benzoate catabolism transcriptional regulator
MTRQMLAHDSGISERYLAQLESGHGNFSILMLSRLADAIDVPLGELVGDAAERPAEYELVIERLRRLTPAELAEADKLLASRFGAHADRRQRIALIGLRGAGKTTLGTMLARHLGWSFVETSRLIEDEAGVKVQEIFDLWGQAVYRRYERRAVEKVVSSSTRVVIATGGGLVSEPATFELLLDSCYTIWIQASPREHWERTLAQGDLRVRRGTRERDALVNMRLILARREPLYAMGDAQLSTSGRTTEQSLADLIELVRASGLRANGGANEAQ